MEPETTKRNLEGYVVLLVDDQAIVCEAVRRLLAEEQDIIFHYCSDGLEAIHQASQIHPTIILLDLVMPGIDGIELVRKFRQDPEVSSTPVIVLSAKDDPRVKSQAFAAGANDYLVKLPEAIELIARIRYHSEAYLNRLQRDEAFRALHVSQQELMSVNTALRCVNEQLEATAAELAASNAELEAFSYSVSHDLRAPLRTIDGFSRALLEDYAGKLDKQGEDYLHRVMMATQRMGHLIDDLLSLSRVSMCEMCREEIDLGEIVRKIGGELALNEPERSVRLIVQNELEVNADGALMKIALTNLLSNAWKFTGRTPDAQIEFGSLLRDGQTVYFIRDNGAGFDMANSKKLFGAFQRLHTAEEFPGTGVGLTTVQRIIRRHGGQIWAESCVNLGSTFYFTF